MLSTKSEEGTPTLSARFPGFLTGHGADFLGITQAAVQSDPKVHDCAGDAEVVDDPPAAFKPIWLLRQYSMTAKMPIGGKSIARLVPTALRWVKWKSSTSTGTLSCAPLPPLEM